MIDAARIGETVEMFADSINVHRDTLYEWTKEHKEFSDSFRLARQAAEVYMQRMGINGMIGRFKNFSPSAWCFWMSARHGWRKDDDLPVDPVEDVQFV